MATTDHDTVIAHYCSACGALVEGRFCSACGHENTLADLPTTSGTGRRFEPSGGRGSGHVAQPATDPGHGRSRLVAVCAAAGVGIAAAAVAAIILLSGGSSSSGSSYQHQLGEALAPMVSANLALSNSLGSLDGSKASVRAATRAAAQAQSALGGTRGAVSVLTVPSSDQALSNQVAQAITEDNGYLQAVASTLATPSGSSAGQLQTLATGAQSALVALNGVAPGAGASISGADNLQSWAHGAQQRATHAPTPVTTSASTATPPSSSGSSNGGASASNSIDCGGGLTAGPHTSCAFAENVQQAWDNTPGDTNTVTAYSPVTGQSYTESCGPQASGGILCTGVGADNSVWWQ